MVVFHNWWFIGTVDFRFRKNVSFHITTMHPKTWQGLWGVTLPTFHEPEGQSSRRDLKLETSNNPHPMLNIQWPGWRIGRWMFIGIFFGG
jgi:hypothetical protein